ncbi:ABC transporter ATP-binding protein [Vineibacter terrae]|uniref:ABC transporter ATP-binding protein n=1 Tax=Vineibacter terrae TaxID=2586908 RepID=A0A5C8PC41_9HYPH|nr:ABC transporter ATP-binding protein [Vineibacter terrae]TXL70624.1 ABC transporter ATP-binding protein [Vineibacter terrae]
MSVLLAVQGLGKSFRGLRAVNDVSFDIREREIVGLIGPNGAGKTTAINLISGAIRPTSGVVRFRGADVTGMPAHRLARLGLIRTFQATNVYAGKTVFENVYVGTFSSRPSGFWPSLLLTAAFRREREQTRSRIEALLEDLGLRDLADTPAADLPYGYQKMLGLATALAGKPKLIMLDEPAAGLSAEEADLISVLIGRVRDQGVSVLVVDHNMRFMAKICNRMVVLHHGMELTSGPTADVVRDPRVLEAYLGTEHSVA